MGALNSVLSSPLVTTLAPIALGVIGGLGSPGTKWGGGLGKALEGGAAGLQQAQETRARQAQQLREQQQQKILDAHYALQDKLLQNDVDAEAQLTGAWNKLPPDQKAQYVTPKIWADAMGRTVIQNMDVPALYNRASAMFNNPQGKTYLASQGYNAPAELPKDANVLKSLISGYKPATAAQEVKTLRKIGPDGKAHDFSFNPSTGKFDIDQGLAAAAPENPDVATERNLNITKTKKELSGTLPARPSSGKTTNPDKDLLNIYLKEKASREKQIAGLPPDAAAAMGITPMPSFAEWAKTDEAKEYRKALVGGASPATTASPTASSPASPTPSTPSASASPGPVARKDTAPPPEVDTPKGKGKFDPAKSKTAGRPVYVAPDGSVWGG